MTLKWILIFVMVIECTIASNVVNLKDKNFTEFVESHEITLVTFYSRQCPHCKAFEPLFEAAAAEAKSLGRPYSFARVEADEEYITADQNKIESLPTVRLFVKGTAVQPDYERGTMPILRYLDKYAKELVHSLELHLPEEILSKSNTVAPQLLLVSNDAIIVDVYKQVAAEFPELNFYYISHEVGSKVFPELTTSPAIVLFKGFDEKKAIFAGTMSKDNIREFVEENKHPHVRNFDDETVGKIFKAGGMKAAILFFKPSEASQRILEEFNLTAVNKKQRGMYFIASDPSTGLGQKVAKIIGIEEEDTPIIIILERKQEMIAYPFTGNFKAKEIEEFVEDWKQGKVSRMPKSENIPKEKTGSIIRVVGKTFKKEVLDFEGDVLVNFCIPPTENCRKFEGIYMKIGENLKGSVKVTEINMARNEAPGVNVGKKYPELKLFLKGDKANPKTYEGELTEKGVFEFVKEHATIKPVIRTDL